HSLWSFFLCSGDPPDPHSFPTRRSSDLGLQRPDMPSFFKGQMKDQFIGIILQLLYFIPPGGRILHDLRLCSGRTEHNQGNYQGRSEEHTSELQSRENLVCRLLLEKKKKP